MKFAKLVFFLIFCNLLISGCNMPRAGESPLPKPISNEVLGEPLYWIQLAYNSEEMANCTNGQVDRPRLALVRDPAEIPAVENWILPQDLPRLQKVDYGAMLVVIVFSGAHGTDQHEILVDQIVTNGNEVIVSVTFTLPPEGVPLSPTMTSPYLIFEVQKVDLPENPDFVLIANGKEIDRVSLHTLDPYPGSSAQIYPPPQTPTLVLAPTSSPETPNPALSGATPIPDDQSFDQAALAHVAQITGTDPGSLSLVETSTVVLPITQKRLWNGIIVHPNQNGGDVYPVLIDADQRIILNGLNFNPQTYWEEAESSFRQANQELILIYLKALGYEPRYVASVNVIDARMTKRDILRLSQAPLDSLGSIHYSGQIPQP